MSTIETWSAFVDYKVGDIVSLAGVSYKSILASYAKQPPNATYWVVYSPGGGGASTWSTFPATTDVDIAGHNISNVGVLDMNNGNIIRATNILNTANSIVTIGTSTTAGLNNLVFSNYGGTLGDVKINSYNTTIGNAQGGTISLRDIVDVTNHNIVNVSNISSSETLTMNAYDMYINTEGRNILRFVYDASIGYIQSVQPKLSFTGEFGASPMLNLNVGGTNECLQPLNMTNHNINNVSNISSSGVLALNGSRVDVIASLNMNDGSIVNLSNIYSGGDLLVSANSNLNLNANGVASVIASGINLSTNAGYNVVVGGDIIYLNSKIIASGNLTMNNYNIDTVRSVAFDAGGRLDTDGSGGIQITGGVSRVLGATPVAQPIIQYGSFTAGGATGSQVVTIPTAYTSATSYVATATMMDTVPCRISVNRNSASQITVYWAQAGAGTQILGWTTMGT